MTWLGAHWIAVVFLLIYTAMIAYHAVMGGRDTHTVNDYYVGGRRMGGVVLGLSFFATYSSTNSFVGFSGQSYTYGAAWLLLAPAAVIFSALAWTTVAPRLRRFTERLDSITVPDYVGFRFSSEPARVAAALIVVFASVLYMTAVYKGIGNLLERFLDVPYTTAIWIVFLIVMIYTAIGGFISVVKTDAVQGTVMVLAAFLLFGGTVRAAGGMGSVFAVADAPETAHLFAWDAAMPFPVLVGIIVAGTMKFLVEPRQLSRFYALEDERATRHGMIVSTAAFLVVYALLVPIGLYAHRVVPPTIQDTDLVVPTLLTDVSVFTPAVGAFLLVAMVAAAMSSLDSVLLVTATTVERDIAGLFNRGRTDANRLRNTRIMVAVFALITAVISLNPPGQIVTLTAFSGSLFAACFFPATVLGLHWRRGNGTAVMVSFAAGILTLVLWDRLPFSGIMHEVFPALALSTGLYALLSVLLPMPPNPTVQALFDESVRPGATPTS